MPDFGWRRDQAAFCAGVSATATPLRSAAPWTTLGNWFLAWHLKGTDMTEACALQLQQAMKLIPLWLRMAVNLSAPAAFVVTYLATRNLMAGIWTLVAVSVAAVLTGFFVERRVTPLPLVLGLAAVASGVLTLIFHDPGIMKSETTFAHVLVGVLMLGGLAFGRSLLRFLLGDFVALTPDGWRRLTLRFGLFDLALAAVNEVVWRTQPDAIWVAFKLPGLPILYALFFASQIPLVLADRRQAKAATGDREGIVITDHRQGGPI